MSGMVTMRARKLRTYQLGMPRWSVGRWPTSAGITSFHGGPSSPRSNVFRFVPKTLGCWHSWVQVFLMPLEWAVLVPFSDSCILSGTGTGDGTLLQKAFPRVSTTVTSQVALRPEFDGSNVKPSGRWRFWLIVIGKHRSSFNARVVDRRMCFIGLVYL